MSLRSKASPALEVWFWWLRNYKDQEWKYAPFIDYAFRDFPEIRPALPLHLDFLITKQRWLCWKNSMADVMLDFPFVWRDYEKEKQLNKLNLI